ncbi:MAG: PEP-CTERM sorting domain-containing protein [Rhodoferax sp.]|nr:PEP-CTERM sorting domain-containing protein [Rhodoferax sp.]
MFSIRVSALAVTLALAAMPAVAAVSPNLIANPGNESALTDGDIPGWKELAGSTWTQRSESPEPFEGSFYFFAGANASAVLRQTIDLSDFGTQIDAGLLGLNFSGRVRSFLQSPADTATITLSFLDASASTLDTFTSGAIANTTEWQLVSSALVAPALARSVQVDLVSTRNGGANNDGYFDDLHLTTVSMVPEPASSALLLAGLAATVALARRRRSTRE